MKSENNEWRNIEPRREFDSVMRFADDGLVLGLGTVLARTSASSTDISISIDEPRLVALLAAAHLRTPTRRELSHIRKAAERRQQGDNALAAMHLVLSGLDHLKRPATDARRLFLADKLLEAGAHPHGIVKALDLEGALGEQALKYNPDQPRVPAGSGRTSGEWTGGAGVPATAPPPVTAPRAARPARNRQRIPQTAGLASMPAASDLQPSPKTPSAPRPSAAGWHVASTNDGLAPAHFSIELPAAFEDAALPAPVGRLRAVRSLGDSIEVADSIEKWRELGPKGEALVRAAVEARGWQVLAEQVYVRTRLGLRVEDSLVHVPAGALGNPKPFDGFIEVKVNGGRYSPLQAAKDAVIASVGGKLLSPVPGYEVGQKIRRGTDVANVSITYVRREA